jgi:hypothetical protein
VQGQIPTPQPLGPAQWTATSERTILAAKEDSALNNTLCTFLVIRGKLDAVMNIE